MFTVFATIHLRPHRAGGGRPCVYLPVLGAQSQCQVYGRETATITKDRFFPAMPCCRSRSLLPGMRFAVAKGRLLKRYRAHIISCLRAGDTLSKALVRRSVCFIAFMLLFRALPRTRFRGDATFKHNRYYSLENIGSAYVRSVEDCSRCVYRAGCALCCPSFDRTGVLQATHLQIKGENERLRHCRWAYPPFAELIRRQCVPTFSRQKRRVPAQLNFIKRTWSDCSL